MHYIMLYAVYSFSSLSEGFPVSARSFCRELLKIIKAGFFYCLDALPVAGKAVEGSTSSK